MKVQRVDEHLSHRYLRPTVHSLYECFLEAFSDYQIELKMSEEQFEQRMKRDAVELELSAGAFDGERMIGFYMNGRGMWMRKLTAYDAGQEWFRITDDAEWRRSCSRF